MPISVPSFHRFLITSWLEACLFTTACVAPQVNAAVQSQSTCIPAMPDVNPYYIHPQSGAVKIYESYVSNPAAYYDDARQKALTQLGINMNHWSDYVDIATKENNMVRIVVTYLDPTLIQYIYLNHILAGSNTMRTDEFTTEVGRRMTELGGLNEMLFLVTITTPFYWEQSFNGTVLTVRIPIEKMTLINASDVRVTPTHEDHILDELLDISHGPVHGIVGFPFGIMNGTDCTRIVDQYTNSLTLDVPQVFLGGIDVGPQFWNIPHHPLVMEFDSTVLPTLDPYYDSTRLGRLETPPTPTWIANAQSLDINWKMYWEDMGRFVWNVVIMESHH
jgi:hypothetical protein